MLNFFLLYKYTITNFEKGQLFLSYFVVMADQFSGLDMCANHTRKIVHTCDSQHACCFAQEKDWALPWREKLSGIRQSKMTKGLVLASAYFYLQFHPTWQNCLLSFESLGIGCTPSIKKVHNSYLVSVIFIVFSCLNLFHLDSPAFRHEMRK